LLCIDQTVEAADHLIPPGPIRDELVGRVEHLDALADGRRAPAFAGRSVFYGIVNPE
jgi:hypothetical protein